MNATLTILSPVPDATAEPAAPVAAWVLPERIRLGTLSNGKPNTAHLLEGLLEVVTAHPRFAAGVREAKESASRPADPAVLDHLAAASDLVVDATAD